MDCKVFFAAHKGYTFKIVEDNPEVGFYLYVFKHGRCIRDYLQNTIQICKEMALNYYGVPVEKWKYCATDKTVKDKIVEEEQREWIDRFQSQEKGKKQFLYDTFRNNDLFNFEDCIDYVQWMDYFLGQVSITHGTNKLAEITIEQRFNKGCKYSVISNWLLKDQSVFVCKESNGYLRVALSHEVLNKAFMNFEDAFFRREAYLLRRKKEPSTRFTRHQDSLAPLYHDSEMSMDQNST